MYGPSDEMMTLFLEMTYFTKNVVKDKYKYLGYGRGFDNHGTFSLSNVSGFGKNVIIFRADMSSSVHVDNKNVDSVQRSN